MTSEPLSSSSAPAEAPIKAQKKGAQLELVRRASVLVGVALLFIFFSVLTRVFTSRPTCWTSCCNPQSTR